MSTQLTSPNGVGCHDIEAMDELQMFFILARTLIRELTEGQKLLFILGEERYEVQSERYLRDILLDHLVPFDALFKNHQSLHCEIGYL